MKISLAIGMFATACVLPGLSAAAGMHLERERLANLEGPETVGQFKFRFDFQHNFQDQTLHPIADLTLGFGLWSSIQAEAEVLLHNQRTNVFGNEVIFQFNVVEYGLKWAILDQTKEDWFSLAVGGAIGRSDIKFKFSPATGLPPDLIRAHNNNRTAYALAHYDFSWVSQYVSVRYASFERSDTKDVSSVTTPGIGERIKVYKSKNVQVHLIGDYQFVTFEDNFSAPAWGTGVQMMYHSPHIFTFFVSNTFGDTSSESIRGGKKTRFYNFRWSYRF